MPDLVVTQSQIKPQDGFQTKFLSSCADITIGGGAAGVGKTWCLQVAPLRHNAVPRFNCITFRRTMEQIKNPGSLWDKSLEIYPMFGFVSNEQARMWVNKQLRISIKYSHLQYEKDIYSHDGSEYCLICFDELQSFEKKQFFYLLSRNRSMCGVMPYVLATCNPDPDSFLAELLEWWIDQDEFLPDGSKNPQWGFPIKERCGVIRYLMVYEDKYIWGNTKQEIIDNNPDIFDMLGSNFESNPDLLIKSITFIDGNVFENQELIKSNPGYLANLMALDEVEKLRLFYGNWKIRSTDKALVKSSCLSDAFSNPYPQFDRTGYITCDAARFGDDLATIFTWQGWKVVRLDIFQKSSQIELIRQIEKNRIEFNVLKSNCLIDQDGVGGYVVKHGKYKGFSGNDNPIKLTELHGSKDNYFNLKAQLCYRYAERINNNEVSFDLDEGSIYVDNYHGCKIKLSGTTYDVRDLIKMHYKAIRKVDTKDDGKKQINHKIDQKRILNGMSPDLWDGSFIREMFAIKNSKVIVGTSSNTKNIKDSILDRI